MSGCLYILRCADGSYCVGTTRSGLETRIAEHESGTFDGYAAIRRPVTLVFHENFERIEDAVAAERQIKGCRQEKKEALIRGDFAALPALSKRTALGSCVLVTVGMRITTHPPHRTGRAQFGHPAPTLGG
jgi:putative endonuclease